MEVPTGLEPMITELQSAALPTWPWNHYFVFFTALAGLLFYYMLSFKELQPFFTKKSLTFK